MLRSDKLKAGKFPVGVDLVRSLVARQFPHYAGLDVQEVESDGWDNWTFRLGDRMKVRLPSAEGYAGQATKEFRWLPMLAPYLPLAVPRPLALGEPYADYPWHWTIYDWMTGEPVRRDNVSDLNTFARDLAGFLKALQRIDSTDGPAAGPHNFFRGGDVIDVYGAEARQAFDRLGDRIEQRTALAVLDAAEAAPFSGVPCWLHGDIAVGNLLVTEGRLSGVIDFGTFGVGDPACDLVIAWLLFGGESRAAFRDAMDADAGCWARARAWALWKAALVLSSGAPTHPDEFSPAEVITALLDDHRALYG
ncbi:MAG: aminoglycoside phosphotransferase family protein [Rhizobium sp.]|nr:aminoglycoside phosphotransferase family protein [Rhizobium sp.]